MLKGPIPSVLVLHIRMQIKCLCPLELRFIVKPQGLHVLLGEMRQCIYVLCNSLLNNQMALLFNINTLQGYIFIARPNLRLESFIYKVYSVI